MLPRSFTVFPLAHLLHDLFRPRPGFRGRTSPRVVRSTWCPPSGDSPRPIRSKASEYCDVLPLSTHELSVLLAASKRSGLQPSFPARLICCSVFRPFRSAYNSLTDCTTGLCRLLDSCAVVRNHLAVPSVPIRNTTQVSPGKLGRPSPHTCRDLHTWPLMDMDFASQLLARPTKPALISGFCSSGRGFAPRFLQTPPRRGCPCALLILHLHQVG